VWLGHQARTPPGDVPSSTTPGVTRQQARVACGSPCVAGPTSEAGQLDSRHRAGIGSLAPGPLPGLLAATPARARADGRLQLHRDQPADTIGSVVHAVNMAGLGTIKTHDVAATLEVVCNVASAGVGYRQPEGLTLTVAGAPFGAFVPIEAGITVFTTVGRSTDGRDLRRTGSGRAQVQVPWSPPGTRTSGCWQSDGGGLSIGLTLSWRRHRLSGSSRRRASGTSRPTQPRWWSP
jgi:hypothetical protein